MLQRAVGQSVAAIILFFYLLNANFYPQLLKYQAGNELAFASRGKINNSAVYFWKDTYSSSFNFYTASLRKEFSDSVLVPGKKTWILYDLRSEAEIKQAGYTLSEPFSAPDYEITKLQLKFVNPATRNKELSKLILAEISKR
jgi:hypothetical protein